MITAFGNVSFLSLCHFWTNLSADVTASRWNVDHLFAVYDRTITLLGYYNDVYR